MAADPAALAVTMARSLRRLGVPTSPDATTAFAAALGHVGLERGDHVYWAGRATLVQHPEDIGDYDRVFAAVFGPAVGGGADPVPEPEALTLLLDSDDEAPREVTGELVDGPVLAVRWSDQEVLADKDFAVCTAAELAELHRLLASVRVTGARRPSRRTRPTRRARGPIDLRATARRALRTAGEPMRTAHRRRSTRPRRVVLLCDVSGSMEAYARALVRFGHAAVAGRTPVEVFTLGTRCTRITRELSSRDPDAALQAAALAVEDWSGGTRLGEGLRAFNDTWGVRGMARGATVVILSDGWDRGDPALLGAQVERLGRVAHRVVWVNPLKAQPGFAPLAQGMAAALPHVDELVEGHSLHALEALAEVLRR